VRAEFEPTLTKIFNVVSGSFMAILFISLFDSAISRLDHLVDLGATQLELMPLTEFSGNRGWGYDRVDLYASHHAYGGPEGLKRLVNAGISAVWPYYLMWFTTTLAFRGIISITLVLSSPLHRTVIYALGVRPSTLTAPTAMRCGFFCRQGPHVASGQSNLRVTHRCGPCHHGHFRDSLFGATCHVPNSPNLLSIV
jgi:hypothetical protein